jgi:hypothetical protein
MINILLEPIAMNFREIDEFQKEFKYFFKRYSSLDSDFKIFKLILTTEPCLVSNNCKLVHEENSIKVLKKRMQCRSLRNTLRVIYFYSSVTQDITLIELYMHNDNKADYDHQRVKEYLKNIPN